MNQTFSSYGLDTVNISWFDKNKKKDGGLPLVISPRWDATLDFLLKWCQENRSWLDEMMIKMGAILIRGFEVNTSRDFQLAFQAYQPSLNNTYRGTSPRKLMGGTDYVFSAAEVPTNYPIAQHLEMSFLDAPPKQLYFGCLKPSQAAGGETAMADFGKVYADISPTLKQKLLDKGIRYQRTHKRKGTFFTYDVSDMLGWPELFGTSDKNEVEQMCAAEGVPVEWTKNDTFVSITVQQAFQLHPVTGDIVWFNHSQVFHWTTFPAELFFAFTRTYDCRLLVHCLFVTIFCVIKYGLLRHKMSLHATFGDGTPISVAEMAAIRRAIHKNMIFARWEKGDMIFLDNFRVSHGRQPTYDKGRAVVVAWANPQRKTNQVEAIDMTGATKEIEKDESLYCMENPQERTPESTLTKQGSEHLHEDLKDQLHHKTLSDVLQNISQNPQELEVSDETLRILKNIVVQAEARNTLPRSHSQPAMVGCPDFWEAEG